MLTLWDLSQWLGRSSPDSDLAAFLGECAVRGSARELVTMGGYPAVGRGEEP